MEAERHKKYIILQAKDLNFIPIRTKPTWFVANVCSIPGSNVQENRLQQKVR